MPVPSAITDLSQTAGSNSPAGSESPITTDDYFRTYASFIAMLRDGKGFTDMVTLASGSTTDIGGQNAMAVEITGTTTITSFGTTYNGPRFLRFTGALTLNHNATTLYLPGAANITTAAGDTCIALPNSSANGWVVLAYQRNNSASGALLLAGTSANNLVQLNGSAQLPAIDGSLLTNLPASFSPPVRQTVLNGPVDSSGLPSFGGSTGSTTVTASGTLTITASNGATTTGNLDKTFQITNPSWTSLSTNGTMYLYVDWNNGTPTTGSTTLAPTYQWGGTYSTTNNQHTYNIQEAVMKVGNGSSAAQAYRVFVGEVTVSGNVVTAITWYAVMGRFQSAATAFTTASNVFFSHNIGVNIEYLDAEVYASNSSSGPWLPNALSYASVTYPGVGLFGGTSRLNIRVNPGINGIFYDNGSGGGGTITSGFVIISVKRRW